MVTSATHVALTIAVVCNKRKANMITSHALAKELVGHETGSVTHDVYSKGASTKQKLAAISKLPSLTTRGG